MKQYPHETESLFSRWCRHTPMKLRDIEKHAVEIDVTLNFAVGARRNYLFKEMDFWLSLDLGYTEWQVFSVQIFWSIVDELVSIGKDLHWKNKPARKDEVTEEMKQRAKAYPVDKLVEFHKGKALAFCHADKTPSLSYYSKINKVSCFVCNKRWDGIDILMMRDGYTYHDAVRFLCGR